MIVVEVVLPEAAVVVNLEGRASDPTRTRRGKHADIISNNTEDGV